MALPSHSAVAIGKPGENVLHIVTIEKDQLITVTNGPFNGAHWVDITWHLKPYMMSLTQLRPEAGYSRLSVSRHSWNAPQAPRPRRNPPRPSQPIQ